jgi:hypothetical protein
VQTEIAVRKNITELKYNILRKTWLVVNKLSGRSQKDTKLAFVKDGKLLSDLELANNLNKFYISVNADIPPLDMTTLPTYLPAVDQVPYIEPYDSSKTCGSGNIPGRRNLHTYSLNQSRTFSIHHFHPGLFQIYGKIHTLLPFQKLNNLMTRPTQDLFH